MALVVQVSLFTPAESQTRGRPYEVQWNLAGASPEQFEAAAQLLAVLSAKMAEQGDLRREAAAMGASTSPNEVEGDQDDDAPLRVGRSDRRESGGAAAAVRSGPVPAAPRGER
jgi:hypothetical protein